MEKGSVDYHNRTDFRALDVFVQAVSNATKDEIKAAQLTCKEMVTDARNPIGNKPVWKDLLTLINKQLRRY